MDQNEIERLRALIAEYDYRRGLNLTDLATLQSELRSTTQENEQLRAKLDRAENLIAAGGLSWVLQRRDEDGEQGISWPSFMAEVHAYTTTLQWATAWKAAAKRERERAETAERELALERDKCGRCGLFISHQPCEATPDTWTTTSTGESWEKST
jgi:chromosome segregation ATPase